MLEHTPRSRYISLIVYSRLDGMTLMIITEKYEWCAFWPVRLRILIYWQRSNWAASRVNLEQYLLGQFLPGNCVSTTNSSCQYLLVRLANEGRICRVNDGWVMSGAESAPRVMVQSRDPLYCFWKAGNRIVGENQNQILKWRGMAVTSAGWCHTVLRQLNSFPECCTRCLIRKGSILGQ